MFVGESSLQKKTLCTLHIGPLLFWSNKKMSREQISSRERQLIHERRRSDRQREIEFLQHRELYTEHLTVRTYAHIFPVSTPYVTFGSRAGRFCEFARTISSAVMSLVGGPSRPFPTIHSSRTCSLTRPSASSTLLTGIRRPPCATPPWAGMSGLLANPTPDTGYEPMLCVDVSDEHTPINLPDSNGNFTHDYDATIATTEDLDVPRHSGFSSSKQGSHRVEAMFIWR